MVKNVLSGQTCIYNSPANIIEIREDERLWNVKTTSNDVLCILPCKSSALFYSKIFPEELLIISELYNQRNLKHILQIPTHHFHHINKHSQQSQWFRTHLHFQAWSKTKASNFNQLSLYNSLNLSFMKITTSVVQKANYFDTEILIAIAHIVGMIHSLNNKLNLINHKPDLWISIKFLFKKMKWSKYLQLGHRNKSLVSTNLNK